MKAMEAEKVSKRRKEDWKNGCKTRKRTKDKTSIKTEDRMRKSK